MPSWEVCLYLQWSGSQHGQKLHCLQLAELFWDELSHRSWQNLHTLFHKGMQIPLKQYECELYLGKRLTALHTNLHTPLKRAHRINKKRAILKQISCVWIDFVLSGEDVSMYWHYSTLFPGMSSLWQKVQHILYFLMVIFFCRWFLVWSSWLH